MTEYIKEKKIINVNSSDATTFMNGSFLSNMTFSFPNILSRNDEVEYLEGSLESAVFPVSFYIINYSNNVLNYTIFHLAVYTNYSITIPVGNYDYKTLFLAMDTAFHLNGHSFTMTLDETTGRMTLTYNQTSQRVFYSINHSTSTCFRVLGFDYNTDYFPTSNILIAPFALNLLGIKKLKIFCPQFSSSNLDTTNYATTTLISTVINDQPPWGQINYYNNTGETGAKLKVFEMNNIDIRITDEYGALINFNNCDWTLTFVLSTFRKGRYNAVSKMNLVSEQFQPPDETPTASEIVPTANEGEDPNATQITDGEIPTQGEDQTANEEMPTKEQIQEDENVTDLDFLMKSNPDYFSNSGDIPIGAPPQ